MITPNLGKPMRVLYTLFGLVMLATPLFPLAGGWLRVGLPLLGLASLAEGLSGW